MYCVHLFIFILFQYISIEQFLLISHFTISRLVFFLIFNSRLKSRGVEAVFSDGEREFLLWMLMWKRVALILCFFFALMNSSSVWFLRSSSPFVVQALRLIIEHVKWQSDKEISSGWLQIVTVLKKSRSFRYKTQRVNDEGGKGFKSFLFRINHNSSGSEALLMQVTTVRTSVFK